MGKWPGKALEGMLTLDPSLQSRVLWKFPHMSGANNGRKAIAMAESGADWSRIVRTWAKQFG